LADLSRSALLICDPLKNIVGYNTAAKDLFSLQHEGSNLLEIFALSEHLKIDQFFEELQRHSKAFREVISWQLANNIQLKCELSVTEFLHDDAQKYFILGFDKDMSALHENPVVRVSIKQDALPMIVQNPAAQKIVEDIRSSFPFTFLGKNRLQIEINKLEEIFWLKDVNDSYIMVNNRFADALGLRPNQLEGKYERNFSPDLFFRILSYSGKII